MYQAGMGGVADVLLKSLKVLFLGQGFKVFIEYACAYPPTA